MTGRHDFSCYCHQVHTLDKGVLNIYYTSCLSLINSMQRASLSRQDDCNVRRDTKNYIYIIKLEFRESAVLPDYSKSKES